MDSAQYVRRVLDAYRATPGTCGVVRKPDRALALRLFVSGVPLAVWSENRICLNLHGLPSVARSSQ